MSVCVCVCVYIYIYIYTHTHTHIYICVCICVYIYIYIYIYSHTHTRVVQKVLSFTQKVKDTWAFLLWQPTFTSNKTWKIWISFLVLKKIVIHCHNKNVQLCSSFWLTLINIYIIYIYIYIYIYICVRDWLW